MGAWGHGVFENDDAADWIYEFRAEGVAAVVGTLEVAAERSEGEMLDAGEGAAGLAAASLVAAARDGDFSALSELAAATVRPHLGELAGAALLTSARQAVDRILGQHSELRALWHEGEFAATEGPQWTAAVEALRKRLAG